MATEQEPLKETPASEAEKRQCRCPLCGKMIVASSQEECIEHMSQCAAFAGVHPEGKPTNYQYYNEEKVKKSPPSAEAADARSAAPEVALHVTAEMVESMGVKDMKLLIARSGLNCDDCIEKPQLRARALEAVAALYKAP